MREPNPFEVSLGGVSADTEVLTCRGPVQISDLEPGDRVYALDVTTQVTKSKPVTQVEPFEYDGRLVRLDGRRFDLLLHPDHRVPFKTSSIETTRFVRAGDMADRVHYQLLNDWQTLEYPEIGQIDITDYTEKFEASVTFDCHGKTFLRRLPGGCEPIDYNWQTGYHFDSQTFKQYQEPIESLSDTVHIRSGKRHWRRPYRFDGDDFIQFLGWFVAEGSVSWASDYNSARVTITQEKPQYRVQLQTLFERLGFDISESNGNLKFSSIVYADLLERWCGPESKERELPGWIWEISTRQQKLLLQTLLDGDGNGSNTYYTSSSKLRDQLIRLCVEVGLKPRYSSNRGVWRVFTGKVNDQLHSRRHVEWRDFDGSLYRLTVEDFPVVLIGRDGKFQWACVSRIA